MFGVEEGVDGVMHVAIVGALEIGGVLKMKSQGFGFGGPGSAHGGLIAGLAVVCELQLAAIEVVHGDHLDGLALLDHANLFEQGGATGGEMITMYYLDGGQLKLT